MMASTIDLSLTTTTTTTTGMSNKDAVPTLLKKDSAIELSPTKPSDNQNKKKKRNKKKNKSKQSVDSFNNNNKDSLVVPQSLSSGNLYENSSELSDVASSIDGDSALVTATLGEDTVSEHTLYEDVDEATVMPTSAIIPHAAPVTTATTTTTTVVETETEMETTVFQYSVESVSDDALENAVKRAAIMIEKAWKREQEELEAKIMALDSDSTPTTTPPAKTESTTQNTNYIYETLRLALSATQFLGNKFNITKPMIAAFIFFTLPMQILAAFMAPFALFWMSFVYAVVLGPRKLFSDIDESAQHFFGTRFSDLFIQKAQPFIDYVRNTIQTQQPTATTYTQQLFSLLQSQVDQLPVYKTQLSNHLTFIQTHHIRDVLSLYKLTALQLLGTVYGYGALMLLAVIGSNIVDDVVLGKNKERRRVLVLKALDMAVLAVLVYVEVCVGVARWVYERRFEVFPFMKQCLVYGYKEFRTNEMFTLRYGFNAVKGGCTYVYKNWNNEF